MTLAWQILIHTPLWVWPLLGLVLWLGWRDLRAHTTSPGRLTLLPAIALSLSLFNVLTTATPLLAVPAWLLGLAAGVPLGVLVARRRPIEVAPGERRLWLAGSWFSMGLGLSIFALRYAMGVVAARDPVLVQHAAWIAAASTVSGGVAGISLGWLLCLLGRYRRAAHPGSLRPDTAPAINLARTGSPR